MAQANFRAKDMKKSAPAKVEKVVEPKVETPKTEEPVKVEKPVKVEETKTPSKTPTRKKTASDSK